MIIHVKLFARARDLAGADQVTLELPATGRVADVRRALTARFPQLSPLAPSLLVAVGNAYASDDVVLDPQAEVACFPPVSGG